MKFSGELKFPEIDHPGVPVQFVIEGSQAELVVEGESLGRWSLYDIHARRLVASAFQIDLEGTEVTFVADDPVDFAYRGVEHMAETWATMKSKRMGNRTLAVRKSRRGTIPSRIQDMRDAMEANLQAQIAPRQIAGEAAALREPADATREPEPGSMEPGDWDMRDGAGAIPLVGSGPTSTSEPTAAAAEHASALTEETRLLEEEKRRIAEERAKLEEERRLAEEREANRIEAYRLEMQRLEAEREELRRQAAEVARRVEEMPTEPVRMEEAPTEPEPVRMEEAPTEPEPVRMEEAPAEPEPVFSDASESVFAPEQEQVEETRPGGVVDLSDLEEDSGHPPVSAPDRSPVSPIPRPASPPSRPDPEPAMVGSVREGKGGLMGAVRAAFRSGSKDHDHQFIEAPGGIGITRYVCEECGYVSISV